MKTLTKYILKLSITPFLMGLVGFVVFASVELLYQLSDIIVRHRVGIIKLFELIYYNLPYFVSLGIPVGILFSIFWVLSQLYSTKEITALLVHGIPSKTLVIPFFVFAIILGASAFYLNDQIVPKYNQKAVNAISKYVYKKPEITIRENVLTKIDENQYFFARKYDQENGILYNVVLFRNEYNEERIVTARKVVKQNNSWYLLNGRMYITDISGFLKLDMKFSKVKLNLKDDLENLMRFGKSPRDMTGKELKEKIQTFKKLGIDPAPWTVELHGRYANSVGPIIIVILGVPLSLLFGLKSKSWSVILTFIIVVLYQGSGAWLSAMGKESLLDPIFSAWLPNLIFGVLGLVLFLFLDTPIAYKIRELLSKIMLFVIAIAILSTTGFSKTLTIAASEVTYSENLVIAYGNVHILWESNELFSNNATITTLDGKAQKIVASGNIIYKKKEKIYHASYIEYTFDKNLAYAVDVKGTADYQNKKKKVKLYVGGKYVHTFSATSVFHNAYVTTCDLEEPHYKVEALNVYVYENKYIVAENSVLLILGIPFFPYPIYFTSLKGDPPFSFSFSWSPESGFTTRQIYVTHYNDLTLKSVFINDESKSSSSFTITKGTGKNSTKFSLDFDKSELKLLLENFTYKTNWDSKETYYKLLLTPIYYEGKYINDDNWWKKLGVNLSNKDKTIKSLVNSYIKYDKMKDKTYFVNSFRVENIKFSLPFQTNLKISNIRYNTTFSTNGLITKPGTKTWQSNINGSYQFSLYDKKFFKTKFTGNFKNDSFTTKITHEFKLPLVYKFEPFEISTNYTFGMSFLNSITDSYILQLGMHDMYSVGFKYEFSPLKLELKYNYRKNFRDEATDTEYNKLMSIYEINTKYSIFSVTRGWDFINNKVLNDIIKTNTQIPFNNYNFTLKTETSYDNENKKLNPSKVSFSITNKKDRIFYNAKFDYFHNSPTPIKEIIHSLTFQKLKGNVVQSIENGFIKRANFKGYFNTFGYKNTLELNYYQTLKTATPNWNMKYTIAKSKNSFSLSYNKDRKKSWIYEMKIGNTDPSFSLYTKYNPLENRITNLKISVSKKLHCWAMNISGEFSFNNDGKFDMQDITKLSVLFYVIEFDEKFFGWDFKENKPDIGLF
ncbi:LptF/LptG family permease [Thermosipho ferrireducens]|uniref:LptF/LptG family permease n=1 Tax=Thermosipho ferrireducens TaxID=2571116 RepID=A0ABX7S6F6_9BACT|nr:LptF/LptG family permease [Thermosipho ferrireducens]QTA37463.1 LptF/LptG family permease [Thermosipho ferrireducens]